MSLGSMLTFSQLSPGERLNPRIHRSAPCHKSTAGLCENHTRPQKACGEQSSNSPECSAVFSVQTGGKSASVAPIIPHRREEASWGTLHAPHERSTFHQWIQKSILAWPLKPRHEGTFFPVTSWPNKSYFKRYRASLPSSFLRDLYNVNPFVFPHTTLSQLSLSPTHTHPFSFSSFWLIEPVRCS